MGRKNSRNTRKNIILKLRNPKGLSVVEVLVAVSIIAILSILAVTLYNPKVQIAKANDARKQSDLRRIATALEDYIGDHPCYPENSVMTTGACGNENLKPYLKSMPCDPNTNQLYKYDRPGPACNKYVLYASLTTKSSNISYNGLGNYVVTSPNYRLVPTIVGSETGPGGGVFGPGEFWGCFSGTCLQMPTPFCAPTWHDAGGQFRCSNNCLDQNGNAINLCQ